MVFKDFISLCLSMTLLYIFVDVSDFIFVVFKLKMLYSAGEMRKK